MDKNIILAGVGGQGILSIAFVIDNAALDAGFEFKQAEVHGMAQRGGAVQSNLRYADHEIYSDLIPEGAADMVLSVEPLEVMRYWHYLRPDGWVVSSVTPYVNIPDYPETEQVLDQLATFPNCILVDGGAIAKAAGNLRAQNMVAVGAASSQLDFTEDQLAEIRRGALQTQGREDRRGQPARLPIRPAPPGSSSAVWWMPGWRFQTRSGLSQKIAPETYDPALAADWASSIGADGDRLASILAGDEIIACDQIPTKV